ncbi:hypothetical protein M3Y99_01966000 [Aphelenchoides fujianensis]|nr:hypothetical protein M3Y99_01966000 [Aphelenchoides fujianensis]
MRSEWSFPFLLVVLSTHGPFVHSLVCYSCTAQLASNVDESSQVAMRLFLESTYQIPPVHRFFFFIDIAPSRRTLNFKTVPTAQCANSDKCVKLSAEGQGLHFVIRGCESHIYKPNVGVQDAVCRCHGISFALLLHREPLQCGRKKMDVLFFAGVRFRHCLFLPAIPLLIIHLLSP